MSKCGAGRGSAGLSAVVAVLLLVPATLVPQRGCSRLHADTPQKHGHSPQLPKFVKPLKFVPNFDSFDVHSVAWKPAFVAEAQLVQHSPWPSSLAADFLHIRVPETYYIGHCQSAQISKKHNSGECPADTTEQINCAVTAGAASGAPDTTWSGKELLIAFDLFDMIYSFQHQYINALPSAGLLVPYFFESPATRAFLCHDQVCNILAAIVGEEGVIRLSKMPCTFYANVTASIVDWTRSKSSWDVYPLGSLYAVEQYVRRFEAKKRKTVPYILFLSRAGSGRVIINEGEVIASLQVLGLPIEIWPHGEKSSLLTVSDQAAAFHGARLVIGLHGGSFANIIYCARTAAVIEINSLWSSEGGVVRRDCFAGICINRGLAYYRFVPQSPFAYGSAAVRLSEADMENLVVMAASALVARPVHSSAAAT